MHCLSSLNSGCRPHREFGFAVAIPAQHMWTLLQLRLSLPIYPYPMGFIFSP